MPVSSLQPLVCDGGNRPEFHTGSYEEGHGVQEHLAWWRWVQEKAGHYEKGMLGLPCGGEDKGSHQQATNWKKNTERVVKMRTVEAPSVTRVRVPSQGRYQRKCEEWWLVAVHQGGRQARDGKGHRVTLSTLGQTSTKTHRQATSKESEAKRTRTAQSKPEILSTEEQSLVSVQEEALDLKCGGRWVILSDPWGIDGESSLDHSSASNHRKTQ